MELEHSPVRVVLLDIEGTVCPISFVQDVLFPYALEVLPSTLATEWDSSTFAPYRDAFPAEYRTSPTVFSSHVHALTASDTKAPYLKSLQGYLWARGYATGALKCPLFSDVAPRLRAWTSPSSDHYPPLMLMIYSSGSIAAQKLLFAHTDSGDLNPLLTDYFDTTTAGPKTDAASYRSILSKYPQWKPEQWLFLSDNIKEVRAALEAGMGACVVVRPGNPPLASTGDATGLHVIDSFEDVQVRPGAIQREEPLGGGRAVEGGEGGARIPALPAPMGVVDDESPRMNL